MMIIYTMHHVAQHTCAVPFGELDLMDLRGEGADYKTIWNASIVLLMNEDYTEVLVMKDRFEGMTGYVIPIERLQPWINKRMQFLKERSNANK